MLTPTASPAAETLFDRYRVLDDLGEGGMGKVLLVYDTKVEEEIALKLLSSRVAGDREFIDRFRNELKLARRIAHRNVCRLYDFNEEAGTPFITMEFVPGRDLKSHLRAEGGKLAPAEVRRITRGICSGLAEAHRLGIVHRDLKPGNVQIDPDGEPRIMDFGLARSSASAGLTQTGSLMGTPSYMSPEQASGDPADERSDLYSVGIMMFEMLAGEPPFKSEHPLSVAMMHKTKAPPELRSLDPEVPEDLAAIVARCLEKDPERRFPSAADLIAALGGAALPEAAPAPPPLSVAPPAFLGPEAEGEESREESVFAAREDEISALDGMLDKMLAGRLQVAFVTGEAGAGKSTLAAEFAHRAQQRSPELVVVSGRCNSQTGTGTAYEPFREVLNLLTGEVEAAWEAGAMSRDQATRLWNLMPASVEAVIDKGPILVDSFLPARALAARFAAHQATTARVRDGLREFVDRSGILPAPNLKENEVLTSFAAVLREVSRRAPILILLDDLHWADNGTANLIFHLARQLESAPVFLLGNYRESEVELGRDGGRHPLETVTNELKRIFGEIVIDLTAAEGRKFLEAYLDSEPNRFDRRFRDALFRLTQGHPLFTVELLRDLRDRGSIHAEPDGFWVAADDLDWEAMPIRAEGVIGERIGRLPKELREILDVAAVEGEQFTAEAVARVLETDERQVVRQLSGELEKRHRLVAAQGIQRFGRQRVSAYRFRHILFQRFLYGQLDEVERSYVHEDVGSTLEELFGDQVERIAPQLARHFELADIPDQALKYHQMAGISALRLSAYVESIPHLTQALELLDSQPAGDQRNQEELTLLSQLGGALTATRGYASEDVERTYTRARELANELSDVPLPILWGIWMFNIVRGDWRVKEELLPRFREMTGSPDAVEALLGNIAPAMAHMLRGDQEQALEEALRAKALYDPKLHLPIIRTYGTELGLFASMYVIWSGVLAGRLDLALEEYQEALARAEEYGDQFNVAEVLAFGTTLGKERGEPERTREIARRLSELSVEQNFPFWLACAQCAYGWVMARDGEAEEGLQLIEQHLALFRATGAKVPYVLELSYQIESQLAAGKIEAGIEVVDEALAVAEETRDRFYDAEIWRLKGELLRAAGDDDGTEAAFRKAIEIAAAQGARALELRAALGLARLLAGGRRAAEGLEALRGVYEAFEEGLETPYLVEARELLAATG